MALLGPRGLQKLALRNCAAALMTRSALLSLSGVEALYPDAAIYNEFTLVLPGDAELALSHMDRLGVTGGLSLSSVMDGADRRWLHVTATDQTTEEDIAAYLAGMQSWLDSLAEVVA